MVMNMYVCVRVSVCVSVCVCVCVKVCVVIYICEYQLSSFIISIFINKHASVSISVSMCMYVYVYIYAHTSSYLFLQVLPTQGRHRLGLNDRSHRFIKFIH